MHGSRQQPALSPSLAACGEGPCALASSVGKGRRAEVVDAVGQYLPQVRAEPGVEGFYVTSRKDDPNTIVFYEVYRSQAAQDFHLQQDFTKKFLATLNSAQAGDRVRTKLVELTSEGQAHSN